jgi:pimeloyl-ACP methyl ester carboxylesterase
VYKPGVIPDKEIDSLRYVLTRERARDAAFDYYRKIVEDMEFNKKTVQAKLPIRLLAVGGALNSGYGRLAAALLQDVKSVVIRDSGHFVPEQQPNALAKALLAFL